MDERKPKALYTDLMNLSHFFTMAGRHLYNHDHSKQHRIVVPASHTIEESLSRLPSGKSFTPFNANFPGHAFKNTDLEIDAHAFSEFLQQNNIQALAPFQSNVNEHIWLGQQSDGQLTAIRIPRKPESARIQAPFVLQPVATMPASKDHPDRGQVEILPFRPVMPYCPRYTNQGHASAMHEAFAIVGQDDFRAEIDMKDYEQALESLAETLRISGFRIHEAQNIGVSPEGWPMFTDPHTVQTGLIPVEKACENLMRFIQESGLPLWDQRRQDYASGEEDEMNPAF